MTPIPLIALSSHRPHGQDGTYARNQIAAHESWKRIFKLIFYFGQPEPDLADGQTRFAPIQDGGKWPTILEMVRFAAGQPHIAVILNADIVLTDKFNSVVRFMQQRGIAAATSKRWQFQMEHGDRLNAAVTDRGLDIFVAKAWLWKQIAVDLPAGYRMGHCEWDTWVLGKLMQRTHFKMGDFTDSRCVFHPIHEGRNMPLNGEVPTMLQEIYDYAKLPGKKITV